MKKEWTKNREVGHTRMCVALRQTYLAMIQLKKKNGIKNILKLSLIFWGLCEHPLDQFSAFKLNTRHRFWYYASIYQCHVNIKFPLILFLVSGIIHIFKWNFYIHSFFPSSNPLWMKRNSCYFSPQVISK